MFNAFAMTQVGSHQPVTMEAWAQSQASPCGISSGLVALDGFFSKYFVFSPVTVI